MISHGFEVVNESCPSTSAPIEKMSAGVGLRVASDTPGQNVDFVTNSMRGILVRSWLKDHKPDSMGRVVMSGKPNRGSEKVNAFGTIGAFEWLNGPAGLELGTGKVSVASTAVAGKKDHPAQPVTPTLLLMNPLMIAETIRFLGTGAFDPNLDHGGTPKAILGTIKEP